MRLNTKNNGTAGYLGPVKTELRKGTGLLKVLKRLTYESGFWGIKIYRKKQEIYACLLDHPKIQLCTERRFFTRVYVLP